MELRHIPLNQLHISPLNMRHGAKLPEITDILPSIRERGILQPLLVRPNADGFEIVAGRRRYFSAKTVEKERGSFNDVPCAVMEAGDDAAALEASLIENAARLDPDPLTQYETFARLILEGRTVGQIALTFGLTERGVEQRLALGNLHPRIRQAGKAEKIDFESLKLLTMATQAKQKEWYGLYCKKDAPMGYRLKQWLFDGQSIPVTAALFALDTYKSEIVTNLFGDERFFVEASEFWAAQDVALAERTDALLKAKWTEVIVLERGHHFDARQEASRADNDAKDKTKIGKAYGKGDDYVSQTTAAQKDHAQRQRRLDDEETKELRRKIKERLGAPEQRTPQTDHTHDAGPHPRGQTPGGGRTRSR